MGIRSQLLKSSSEYKRLQEKLAKLEKRAGSLASEKNELLKCMRKRGGIHTRLWEPEEGSHPYGQVTFDKSLAEVDETLKDRLPPPAWATGYISDHDAALLRGLIAKVRPARMVEVGVASGYSTAVILDAMARHMGGVAGDDAWLHSFDIIEHCYFDASRRTGSAVEELVPDLRPKVEFHFGGTALAVRDLPGEWLFDLAFIDASHDHPWPVFDTLALLPRLKPGAWIVLHDILLPFSNADFQCCGANLLFSLWPGDKLMQPPGLAWRNAGAIRYDGDWKTASAMLASLFQLPWETSGPDEELIKAVLG